MIIRRQDWTGEERERGWGTLKWKKKRKRTCHVANTSKEPTSPLEVAWWGSKYHEEPPLGPRTAVVGEVVGQGPSSFSHICIRTRAHARTSLSFTTCTVQLQGSVSLSQTTSPNKLIQLHLLFTLSPCSSRSRSHGSRWGRTDYCWVKFTSLCKLFDITNKVKVYQNSPEDYIIMVCQVARFTSRYKKQYPSPFPSQWAEHKPVEVTQQRPKGTQRGLQLQKKKKIIAHYQPSILSTMKHLQTPSCQTSMVLKLILWVPFCTIKICKGTSDISATLQLE